jgi:hypothetical protein
VLGKLHGLFIEKKEVKHSGKMEFKKVQEMTNEELERVISGG